jgi:hypothetical protein
MNVKLESMGANIRGCKRQQTETNTERGEARQERAEGAIKQRGSDGKGLEGK